MHKKYWNATSQNYISPNKHVEDSTKDSLDMHDVKHEFEDSKYGEEKHNEPRQYYHY